MNKPKSNRDRRKRPQAKPWLAARDRLLDALKAGTADSIRSALHDAGDPMGDFLSFGGQDQIVQGALDRLSQVDAETVFSELETWAFADSDTFRTGWFIYGTRIDGIVELGNGLSRSSSDARGG